MNRRFTASDLRDQAQNLWQTVDRVRLAAMLEQAADDAIAVEILNARRDAAREALQHVIEPESEHS